MQVNVVGPEVIGEAAQVYPGAKAAGEVAINAVAPALLNAVYNATGLRFYKIPLTPERVWRALREREHSSRGIITGNADQIHSIPVGK